MLKQRNRRRLLSLETVIHLYFILFSLLFVVPFLLVIAISISSEANLEQYGYRLLPISLDFTSYATIFARPDAIVRAYAVTALESFVATVLSVLVMSLCAYPLSRSGFKFRKPITYFILFTMLFGGGLIPKYILFTQYYHIGNTIWIYILPMLASAFYIIIFMTFFRGLSEAIIESSKIDGAGEFRIFWQIVAPLSTPVIATLALFTLLDRWNDWYSSLIYIHNEHLYTLQYLLERILREAEFLQSMAHEMNPNFTMTSDSLPTESVRFALAVVAAGPLLVIFPFFQKYFTRGLTIGAVKG